MASMIQAILARDVRNLGRVGEIVRVRPGYLRNFLLPQRMALPLSKQRLEHFEHQKQLINHQIAKLKATSEHVRDRIEAHNFTIEVKAGEQGKLFGSVGTRDIEAALAQNGFMVDHRDIKLESPLKSVGLHMVPVRLEGDVKAMIRVVLVQAAEPVSLETNPEEEVVIEGTATSEETMVEE